MKGNVMKDALRILNLEDNTKDAELNQTMLSARWPRCELVRVDNRDDYLAALEQGNIDVILSDYTMPGFDGGTALALAREKHPEIPFLFVSGTIGEDSAIEALKNGATDYVLKHRLERLIPAVERALRQADESAERERAEEAMPQSEYKYRELFESLSRELFEGLRDAAFLADEHSGEIIAANRRAEILLGCSRAEILGRPQSQ
ncbi:MAG TPA: response regulator, partial [Verrucomicrobiae bacterium]|nr:response regulator [Verrucomicrobiae bacterium]